MEELSKDVRAAALIRFAISTTILNVLGHTILGFEISVIQPFVAISAAIFVEFIMTIAVERDRNEKILNFSNVKDAVVYFLPAYIVGMTISMFLYPGERIWPLVFASALAIVSKYLIVARIGSRVTHFLNPANAAIILTLAIFGSVTVSPPWSFGNKVFGYYDIVLPLVIAGSGVLLNFKTGRLPLIAGWLGGYVLQAAIRSAFFDANFLGIIFVATGPIAMLFTFYMITDPGTTPIKPNLN